jgi:hypothetical protein
MAMNQLLEQAIAEHGKGNGVNSQTELKKAEVQCGFALAGHHIAQNGVPKHRAAAHKTGLAGDMREATMNTKLADLLAKVEAGLRAAGPLLVQPRLCCAGGGQPALMRACRVARMSQEPAE